MKTFNEPPLPSGEGKGEGLISLKDLAVATNPDNWELEYAAIRQRAKRGKYNSYKIIGGKGFVNKNDIAIAENIRFILQDNVNTNCHSGLDPESKSLHIIDNNSELSGKQLQIALSRAGVIKNYLEFAERADNNTIATKHKFVNAYNHKAFPALHEITGNISFKTIERWKKAYLESNKDYRVLAPQYKMKKASSVTPAESEVLTRLFLNPNQPLISEVVRNAMNIFTAKRFENIKSANTYRRYLLDWKKEHYADYIFFREGEKALDDKVLPYLERDYNKISVGDIIVADGHILNFEIINPYTGKPKRMMMVLFYDMKSSFPLGWDIAPTENTITIAIALRRSILRLGKFPRIIYLDNGRAFGAKFFNGIDFKTSGITGLFERLGAKIITAIPYHGQSKTIERFFRTFSEIERMMPSYSGTSIELKPAHMNRGEKLHMKLHEKMMHGTSLDITAAHKAIAWWFDRYAERPQQDGHLKGIRPLDVFDEGKGPGIDKAQLVHLMMSQEIKSLGRNGIRMFGTSYWNEALFGKEWDNVLVRYDLIENDSIFVYDESGEFICEAKRIDKVHPAAGILGTEEDVKLLHEQLERKQSLKKLIVGDAKKFLAEEVYPEVKKQFNEINVIQLNEEQKQIEAPKQKSKKTKNIFDGLKLEDKSEKEKPNYFSNIAEG